MGDRSNVNIITEARRDGVNVGVNVYLHWGGVKALNEALETLRPYVENIRLGERVFLQDDPARAITAVLHALYEVGGYAEPFNVYVTPFSTSREGAIGFTGDNEHVILTIDIPRGLIVLRDEMDERTRELPWNDVDAAEDALADMEKASHEF